MDKLKKIKFIVIHHSERDKDFPFFIKFRHKYKRKWEDIGYHYLIGNGKRFAKNGKLYIGRSISFRGAHVFSHNNNSIGICLIGNLDKTNPTKKQIKTLIVFLKKLLKKYNLKSSAIRGHREFPKVIKTCPGKYINLDFIREKVDE